MKRIISTILALVPGVAMGGVALWMYGQWSTSLKTAASNVVTQAQPLPTPRELNPEEQMRLQFEEERLANLRESLEELKEPSLGEESALNEVEAQAAGQTPEPSPEPSPQQTPPPDASGARIAMLEAEINSLSHTKSAIEGQLQQLDTQILELQSRLPTLTPDAKGGPNPQLATLQNQLSALKATREQIEEQRRSAPLPADLDAEIAGGLDKVDTTGERLNDLRSELEYWQERQRAGDTPELRERRIHQLEQTIAQQQARVNGMQRETARRDPEESAGDGARQGPTESTVE